MFGHIKAEEFLNLIEGASLAADRHTHLDSCPACQARLQSVKSVHTDISMFTRVQEDIPEPDWNDFRSSVRTELLSRSVQRESAVRRWTGWSIRPAMAWALSLGFVVCLMTGGFLWHISTDRIQQTTLDAGAVEPAMDAPEAMLDISADVDPAAVESEKTVWASAGVFEDISQLKGEQTEQLRQLLESASSRQ